MKTFRKPNYSEFLKIQENCKINPKEINKMIDDFEKEIKRLKKKGIRFNIVSYSPKIL